MTAAEAVRTKAKSRAREIFDLQRAASRTDPYPSYEQRRDNLKKLERILLDNQTAIIEAISKDFGNRSEHETKLVELFAPIDGIRYCLKNLKKWMKPQSRSVSVWFAGATNSVLPQPKGVIGIAAPWNYPLFLTIGPVTCALAAGNRCMVKMAANSKNICALMAELISNEFSEDTLVILPGVPASEFTPLPFDHLVFTGSPETGKTVMNTAADNLTPVTLELGGKSPTIICADFDVKTAAERILWAKFANAGQTCVAPDHVYVPEARVDEFVKQSKALIAKRYPTLDSKDYTSIISDSAFKRIMSYVADGQKKGAEIINLMSEEADAVNRKIPPMLALEVDDSMALMREEIFGPILPVLAYSDLDDVLEVINDGPRPLGLYLFTNDEDLQDKVTKQTCSGGMAINDCSVHAMQHDMPFGGIGNSGMGHYHAYEGFLEFSKMRPIFKQFKYPALPLLYPPYGKVFDSLYELMLKLKM